MEFRTHLKRLEEVGAKGEGLNRAYVVAAAGGEYDYVKLRRALLAIVPTVNKEEDGFTSRHTPPGNRQWKPRANQTPRQVHATTDESAWMTRRKTRWKRPMMILQASRESWRFSLPKQLESDHKLNEPEGLRRLNHSRIATNGFERCVLSMQIAW